MAAGVCARRNLKGFDRLDPAGKFSVKAASLLTLGPFDARLRCECCDLPSIRVPFYSYDFHLENSQLVCVLCDWENSPLTHEGLEEKETPSPEERNEGVSLVEARANFARFLSMYDPEKPRPWMLGPPSAEILERKQDLRNAYLALLAAPRHGHWNALNVVKDCEDALAAQVTLEQERAQDTP